jgi:hypothetical protein
MSTVQNIMSELDEADKQKAHSQSRGRYNVNFQVSIQSCFSPALLFFPPTWKTPHNISPTVNTATATTAISIPRPFRFQQQQDARKFDRVKADRFYIMIRLCRQLNFACGTTLRFSCYKPLNHPAA